MRGGRFWYPEATGDTGDCFGIRFTPGRRAAQSDRARKRPPHSLARGAAALRFFGKISYAL